MEGECFSLKEKNSCIVGVGSGHFGGGEKGEVERMVEESLGESC